jgi:hypothetical protein
MYCFIELNINNLPTVFLGGQKYSSVKGTVRRKSVWDGVAIWNQASLISQIFLLTAGPCIGSLKLLHSFMEQSLSKQNIK